MNAEQLAQLKAQLQDFKLKLCDSNGLYATASDYDELRAQTRDLIAEVERQAETIADLKHDAMVKFCDEHHR